MVSVGVSSDYNLVSFECTLREPDCYLVGKCRLYLVAAGV